MEIKDMLIRLSDLIDMHEYNENWEKEAQELITKISERIGE